MTRRNKLWTASAIHLIACTRRSPATTDVVHTAQHQSADADAGTIAVAQRPLAEEVPSPIADDSLVTADRFARSVLYTWTSRAQADALRHDPLLLSRSESAVHGPSFYDQTMTARAATGDRVAALLRIPAFARARFAWPSPWATVRGWPGEQYGHSLLRVTLKADALILQYSTRTRAWTLHDLSDRELPLSVLEAHPTRLAAVYFVHDMRGSPNDPIGTNFSEGGAPYREYVLCNESMIEQWELGTDATWAAITDGARLATALANATRVRRASPRDWPRHSTAQWNRTDTTDPFLNRYLATIAFLNELYLPTAENLDAIAAELTGVARDLPPLVHVVSSVPPAPAPHPPRRRLPARPIRQGTY